MSESTRQLNKTMLRDADGRRTVHSQRAEAARGRGARSYDARIAAESPAESDHKTAFYDALHMPTRQLENRCARTAAKTGKFLASARAIIEPDFAYFLELRQRLNSQGKRGGHSSRHSADHSSRSQQSAQHAAIAGVSGVLPFFSVSSVLKLFPFLRKAKH